MKKLSIVLATLLMTIGLTVLATVSAHAEQNSGYNFGEFGYEVTPSPSVSPDYFDPHDQDIHGDLPK